jgi:hypothetical protein
MEPDAIPFEKKPKTVGLVLLVLYILVTVLERLFYSDTLQEILRSRAKSLMQSARKALPAFSVDGNAIDVETAASPVPSDPATAGNKMLLRFGTDRTLLNE